MFNLLTTETQRSNNYFALCVSVVIVLVLVSSGCRRERTEPDSNTRNRSTIVDLSSIDRLLAASTARLGGGSALILIKDDEVIYRKAFGRFASDEVVPIASGSKWLTAAVILKLSDEGKLSLDDPVKKFLPYFNDEKGDITIRQLLSHTSGLPAEAPCRNDRSTTLADCAQQLAGLPLQAQPGAEFHYGGVSMHIAGRIAEVVTGRSWEEIFQESIAQPLEMKNTSFYAYGTTANPRPAGDARSTIDDYGNFLSMVLNKGVYRGHRILSAGAIEAMLKDQTAGAPIAYTIYRKHGALDSNLPQARYGLGVWREKLDDNGELVEASSQGALGFSPWIDLEHNLAGVLLVRSSMSRVMPVYLQVKQIVRQASHNTAV